MNEYEKSFYEDIREKKKAASGAYHRATRGKRAFTVHNQSDHLTKKELKKMSGEVVSFMQKPIKWDDFRDMPLEAQRNYVQWLKDEYNATAAMISEMLEVHRSTFCVYNKEVLWLSFSTFKPTEAVKKRWQEFCNGGKDAPEEIPISKEAPVLEELEKPCGVICQCDISANSVDELIELLKRMEPILAAGKVLASLRVLE